MLSGDYTSGAHLIPTFITLFHKPILSTVINVSCNQCILSIAELQRRRRKRRRTRAGADCGGRGCEEEKEKQKEKEEATAEEEGQRQRKDCGGKDRKYVKR